MAIITPNEGLWAPEDTDLANLPADLLTLGRELNTDYSGWLTAFASATNLPAFLLTCTANNTAVAANTGLTGTFQTTTVNQGGGTVTQFSGTSYREPQGLPQGWWLIGCSLGFSITSGTPIALTYYGGSINVNDFDPASRTDVDTRIQGADVETNTGGNQGMNIMCLVKTLGDASITVNWVHNDTGASKCMASGSLFYGVRLGNA